MVKFSYEKMGGRGALLAALIWPHLGMAHFVSRPGAGHSQTTNELAKLASFSGNEGPLAKLSNAQKLTTFCTSDVEITVEGSRTLTADFERTRRTPSDRRGHQILRGFVEGRVFSTPPLLWCRPAIAFAT